MSFEEFSIPPLPARPITFAQVAEGNYLAAGPDAPYDHLVTLGLYTCKAVSLHNEASGQGVLAHVDGTVRLPSVLSTILEAYDDDPSTADVKIIQTIVSEDTYLWPRIESIADFFMEYSPRSLMLDRNRGQLDMRGVALNLRSGQVYETDYDRSIVRDSRHTPNVSLPLRSTEKVY